MQLYLKWNFVILNKNHKQNAQMENYVLLFTYNKHVGTDYATMAP